MADQITLACWSDTYAEFMSDCPMDVRGQGSCMTHEEAQRLTCLKLGITEDYAIERGFIQEEEKKKFLSLPEESEGGNQNAQLTQENARLKDKIVQLQEIIKRLSRQLAEQEYELSVVRREDLRPGRLANIQSGVITYLRDKIAQLTKENHQLKGENPPSNFFLPQTRTKDSSSSGNAQVLTLTPQNNEGDGDTEMPSYENISHGDVHSEMNDTPGNDTSQDVDTFENPSFMGDEMGASSAELAEKRFLESFKNNGGNYKKNIKIYII